MYQSEESYLIKLMDDLRNKEYTIVESGLGYHLVNKKLEVEVDISKDGKVINYIPEDAIRKYPINIKITFDCSNERNVELFLKNLTENTDIDMSKCIREPFDSELCYFKFDNLSYDEYLMCDLEIRMRRLRYRCYQIYPAYTVVKHFSTENEVRKFKLKNKLAGIKLPSYYDTYRSYQIKGYDGYFINIWDIALIDGKRYKFEYDYEEGLAIVGDRID